METSYSLVTFDVRVIETILADTYPLTAESPNLLADLAALRHEVMIANNKMAIFFGIVETPLTRKELLVRDHNAFMAAKCEGIIALCSRAIETLAPMLV